MSSTTTDLRRMASLPKWARDRIETLERNLEYAQAKLAVGPAESDTFADPYGAPRSLGVETTVLFELTKREDGTPRDYVQVRTDVAPDGTKRVYVHASDSLAFYPQSSNTGYVKLGRP